jgi:hypothetical protein
LARTLRSLTACGSTASAAELGRLEAELARQTLQQVSRCREVTDRFDKLVDRLVVGILDVTFLEELEVDGADLETVSAFILVL